MDPIMLEVMTNVFLSIAEEMGTAFVRSSYSNNIKERRDCSAALIDANGRTISQAHHIPMHFGSLLTIVQSIRERYTINEIYPGDVFIANDPYSGAGTHLPDIALASPIFVDEKLVAFVSTIGHHADRRPNGPTIWDEGLRIPPIKLISEGQMRKDVLEFILVNYRLRDERLGDFRAHEAANKVGIQRFKEACVTYSKEVVMNYIEELMKYAARKTRAAIKNLPDGIYKFTDYMDDDGIHQEPIPISVTVKVEGDEITLDFSGSGKQVEGDINLVWTSLLATVYYALTCLLDYTIPANSGYFDCINVMATPGTIVNAVEPAPVHARSETAQRVVDVIFGALAEAIPHRVIAASNGSNCTAVFSGNKPKNNDYYMYLECYGGGSGARPTKDGLDGVQVHITNSSNLPVECLETEYPLEVKCYELVNDSGGSGKYRGGLSLRRRIEILGHTSIFTGHVERARLAPWGLKGGKEGGKGRFTLNRNGQVLDLGGKPRNITLNPGDIIEVKTAGGGGYGNPEERNIETIKKDLTEGKITLEKTFTDYPQFSEEML